MTWSALRRCGAPAVALGFCLAAAPAAAQEGVTAAEVQQITCHVMTVPDVRAAIQAGSGPLLVVSGRVIGPLRMPSSPCPPRTALPRGVTEFRIVAAHTAPQLYGERGRNGAVLVDLPPVPPR